MLMEDIRPVLIIFHFIRSPEKVNSESNGSVVRYSFVITRDLLAENEFDAIGLYAKGATGSDISNYSAIVAVKPTGVIFEAVTLNDVTPTLSF